MIVVIADDFTGAAEVAGLGLRHGLTVELDIEGVWSTGADLLVIATDTRSKILEEALKELQILSDKIAEQKPLWIYKKIDSVLRGHIIEETQSLVESLNMKGAIIVPANPALGRVIIDGIYYIDGKPLQSTSFSEDPEFKIASSMVASLLSKNGSTPVFEISKPDGFLGKEGIVVGEASTSRDLDSWAEMAGPDWLLVGAAGFFDALLSHHGMPLVNGNNTSGLPDDARTLYLCGSTFQGSRDQVTEAYYSSPSVCFMPEDIFWKRSGYENEIQAWIHKVVSTIEHYNKAILAVREPVIPEPSKSNWIKQNFALIVKELFERTRIEELIIEGGSTASAVLNNMGLTRLVPMHQFQQGVIRMRVENIAGLNLTLKPGSYKWPETVWKF
jgi:uncharacterized protein YgbK (DUF1537 family)